MNKGTAIVGFFLCFLAGMGLMWGIDRSKGAAISAEGAEAGSLDHSASPIPVTSKDPSWGNADAPVTIVEISDFQCPFCSRVGPTMKQIKDTYGPARRSASSGSTSRCPSTTRLARPTRPPRRSTTSRATTRSGSSTTAPSPTSRR